MYKKSFLNSNKGKELKKRVKDFNFKSEHNKKNEPKKLIINSKFNYVNKNDSSSNIINSENIIKKRYNLNYINVKSNENKEINNKLKNIEENIKEEK